MKRTKEARGGIDRLPPAPVVVLVRPQLAENVGSAARAMRETGPAFFSSKRKATARPLYLRGLALHGDLIFAGFSPATIFCIDRHSGKLVDAYFHSDDARDCIHGLAVSD